MRLADPQNIYKRRDTILSWRQHKTWTGTMLRDLGLPGHLVTVIEGFLGNKRHSTDASGRELNFWIIVWSRMLSWRSFKPHWLRHQVHVKVTFHHAIIPQADIMIFGLIQVTQTESLGLSHYEWLEPKQINASPVTSEGALQARKQMFEARKDARAREKEDIQKHRARERSEQNHRYVSGRCVPFVDFQHLYYSAEAS